MACGKPVNLDLFPDSCALSLVLARSSIIIIFFLHPFTSFLILVQALLVFKVKLCFPTFKERNRSADYSFLAIHPRLV